MTKKNMYINYKFILFLLIVSILAGCNKSPQKPDISKNKNLPKLPKVLTELENEILKIMYDLDSTEGIKKTIEKETVLKAGKTNGMDAPSEQDKQEQNNMKEKDQSKTTEKKDLKQMEEAVDMQKLIAEKEIIIPLLDATGIKGSFAEDTIPPPDIDKVWEKTNDSITEIHRKWNVLEAQLPLEKTSLDKIKDFEKTLDDLTMSVRNKAILDSLKLANELTGIMTNFRNYFDGIGNHDVYKMQYHIRNCILSAASGNYLKAINHLNETSKIGDSMRQDLIKKGSEDILRKFELSIEDLKEQLTDENFYLSQIKASIIIKNIKLIQNVFETQDQT